MKIKISILCSFLLFLMQKFQGVTLSFQRYKTIPCWHETPQIQSKFKGLPVFGGEVIYHLKNDSMASITGEYFQIKDLDTTPTFSREETVEIFRSHLQQEGLGVESEAFQLIIFPA